MAKRKKSDGVNEKVAARRAARKAAQAANAAGAAGEGVRRTFAGLPGEADWVAMREVVPAATATARTTSAHGSRDVVVASLIPGMLPAMHRTDGVIMVALQTASTSADPSRDVAAALLEILDTEPGTSLDHFELPGPGPRLQDVLDTEFPFEVTVHAGFDFVVPDGVEPEPELAAALEEFAQLTVPTVKVPGVEAAYWCRMGAREFLRWSRTEDEELLLDALARLHAKRESGLDEDARFIGAFRSSGLVVPVWELARGTEAEELDDVLGPYQERLLAALAVDEPLTADERRARAGIVSRQVTLR
ncbi:topoisomerase II [Occultella glacieicola]|uniref:Topoisomerase II n=1 Tax=Occultella glacieicola TaxID=2518684 RepID=A0ABY2E434_9MICO|nr:DUF5926 family protein [Occultella glacieicola]TDE91518.1 topoisomerase II [Occultella glacieicola]